MCAIQTSGIIATVNNINVSQTAPSIPIFTYSGTLSSTEEQTQQFSATLSSDTADFIENKLGIEDLGNIDSDILTREVKDTCYYEINEQEFTNYKAWVKDTYKNNYDNNILNTFFRIKDFRTLFKVLITILRNHSMNRIHAYNNINYNYIYYNMNNFVEQNSLKYYMWAQKSNTKTILRENIGYAIIYNISTSGNPSSPIYETMIGNGWTLHNCIEKPSHLLHPYIQGAQPRCQGNTSMPKLYNNNTSTTNSHTPYGAGWAPEAFAKQPYNRETNDIGDSHIWKIIYNVEKRTYQIISTSDPLYILECNIFKGPASVRSTIKSDHLSKWDFNIWQIEDVENGGYLQPDLRGFDKDDWNNNVSYYTTAFKEDCAYDPSVTQASGRHPGGGCYWYFDFLKDGTSLDGPSFKDNDFRRVMILNESYSEPENNDTRVMSLEQTLTHTSWSWPDHRPLPDGRAEIRYKHEPYQEHYYEIKFDHLVNALGVPIPGCASGFSSLCTEWTRCKMIREPNPYQGFYDHWQILLTNGTHIGEEISTAGVSAMDPNNFNVRLPLGINSINPSVVGAGYPAFTYAQRTSFKFIPDPDTDYTDILNYNTITYRTPFPRVWYISWHALYGSYSYPDSYIKPTTPKVNIYFDNNSGTNDLDGSHTMVHGPKSAINCNPNNTVQFRSTDENHIVDAWGPLDYAPGGTVASPKVLCSTNQLSDGGIYAVNLLTFIPSTDLIQNKSYYIYIPSATFTYFDGTPIIQEFDSRSVPPHSSGNHGQRIFYTYGYSSVSSNLYTVPS